LWRYVDDDGRRRRRCHGVLDVGVS
jgi:hypothetical protein